jgi:hypothetical protein
MKKLMIASAILIGGFISTAAEAMPTGAPMGSVASTPSNLVQVDYACGPGFHQTPWGDCRRNGWRRPPPPPRFYGHHRPPPRDWDRREWHHRYYNDY